jgi:hypothetical protein
MSRLAAGLSVGDAVFDALPLELVSKGCKDASDVPQADEPDWVDWDMVERGRKAWEKRIGSGFIALSAALMQVRSRQLWHPQH